MNKEIEHRNMRLDSVIENADGSFLVSGYVNRTEEWSQVLGNKTKFRERIAKGVFERALQRAKNVEFLYEHNKTQILADTKSQKLSLEEDENGLFMRATISPTSWGKDAYQLIKDGIVQNMSFGMKVVKDTVKRGLDGIFERTVNELELIEVSAVRNPAYVQSSIEARSLQIEENLKNGKEYSTMNKFEIENELRSITARGQELDKANMTRPLTAAEISEHNQLSIEKRNLELQLEKLQTGEVTEVTEERDADYASRVLNDFLQGNDTEEIRELPTALDGGTLMPKQVTDLIVKKLENETDYFSLSKQLEAKNGFTEVVREKLFGSAGFIGEMEDLETTDFSMEKIRLDQKRLGTAIIMDKDVIENGQQDVIDYAFEVLRKRIIKKRNHAILFGDKTKEFEGIVFNQSTQVKVVQAQKADLTFDDLLALVNAMDPDYQKDAVLIMNQKTFIHFTKQRTVDGLPVLNQTKNWVVDGIKNEILGLPVIIDNNMDDMETGKKPILLANFAEGYATTVKKEIAFTLVDPEDLPDTDPRRAELYDKYILLADTYGDGKIYTPDALKILSIK